MVPMGPKFTELEDVQGLTHWILTLEYSDSLKYSDALKCSDVFGAKILWQAICITPLLAG